MKAPNNKSGLFACWCLVLFITVAEGSGVWPTVNMTSEERKFMDNLDDVPLDNVEVMGPGGPTGKEIVRLHKTLDALREEVAKSHYTATEREDIKTSMTFDNWLEEFKEAGAKGPIPANIQHILKIGGTSGRQLRALVQEEIAKSHIKEHSRSKRSVLAHFSSKWTDCKIPWRFSDKMYDTSYGTEEKLASLRHGPLEAMIEYEKYTGFRFIHYTGNNTELGLDHDNYAKFEPSTKGCWSFIGNGHHMFNDGQGISACTGETSLHEIGHMLRLSHEQSHPRSAEYMRTDFSSIQRAFVDNFKRERLVDIDHANTSFYDPTSIMHYAPWAFSDSKDNIMFMYDSDDRFLWNNMGNTFYTFRDLQNDYDCFSQFDSCTGERPTCHWGGYLSVVDGYCSCMCPEGMDPASGCTKELIRKDHTRWPTGMYSIFKSTLQDCPKGFEPGSIVAWPAFRIWKTNEYHSAPFDPWFLQHDTCTKTKASTGTGSWPAGRYCLLRYGGKCPAGFKEGRMETYGLSMHRPDLEENAKRVNKGVQPDGEHTRTFVYIFCCRDDGSHSNPIDLHLTDHIILFPFNNLCQQITDTFVKEEVFVWKNAKGHDIKLSGTVPKVIQQGTEMVLVSYCVYFPVKKGECGVIKTFTNDETSYTFATPNHPSTFPKSHECYWRFMSPPDTVMQLDFNSFDIPPVAPYGVCGSHVELKTWHPGYVGLKFCGVGYKKTHWTKLNHLTLKFTSDLDNKGSGFKATITIRHKDDQVCFKGDGSKGVYAGNVNYGRNFAACLYWDEMTECPFNAFDPRVNGPELIGHNNCRKVGIGAGPWCYVNKDNCERQICDPCSIGACFDLWDGCLTHVEANPTYCTVNEFKEAERLCRKTCGVCAPPRKHRSHVSCPPPEDVESVAAVPASSSYKVGEIVKYTCTATGVYRTRTCTSEGTWTQLNAVCNACPTGWIGHKNKCYKWLGHEVLISHGDAQNACAALQFGSILPQVVDYDEAQFIQKIITIDKAPKASKVWVGAVYTPGVRKRGRSKRRNHYEWLDGTIMQRTAMWFVYEPDTSHQCVTMDAKWKSASCGDKNFVVCELVLPDLDEASSCVDTSDNCIEALERTPDLCTKYPDYAMHNCRVTCGVGVCNNTSVLCTQADDLPNVERNAESVGIGEYIENTCSTASHTFPTSGSFKRACLPSGNLTGTDPVCSDSDYLLVNADSISMKSRPKEFNSWRIVTANNKFMRTPIAGAVTSFILYGNFIAPEDRVYVLILRRVTVDNFMKLQVVHSIQVTGILDDRITKFKIPANETFDVEKGDYIGIYMSYLTISYTQCNHAIEPENDHWIVSSNPFDKANVPGAGTDVDFVWVDKFNPGNRCRIYSIWYEMDPA